MCRKIKSKHVLYMNDELSKSINVRNMLKRKYKKINSQENWIRYRAHRNHVNSLRKKSLQQYIKIKCNQPNICNGKEFWKTIKPIISNK